MTDKAREEFEAWFKHNYQWFIKQGLVVYGLERSQDPLNHYVNPIPNHDYRVWLASREEMMIDLSDLSNCFSPNDCGDWAMWLDDVKKLAEAAGLKVKL